jgi:hypothetical protein
MASVLEAAETISVDASKPAAEQLRELLLGWWRMLDSTAGGGVQNLLMGESHNFPELVRRFDGNVTYRVRRTIMRVIELGIVRGEFRHVDELTAASIVFSPLFFFIVWRQSFGPLIPDLQEPEVFFAQAVDMLVNGLVVRERTT